jgi:hypothetical protein
VYVPGFSAGTTKNPVSSVTAVHSARVTLFRTTTSVLEAMRPAVSLTTPVKGAAVPAACAYADALANVRAAVRTDLETKPVGLFLTV